MITKVNPSTRRRAQPLQIPCSIRICHCSVQLAASFVACCVSGLSCPTYSAVATRDPHCCVSCLSKLAAPSRKPLLTVFEPRATETFHFVCSSCFLLLKRNPAAIASVCFGSCVQEKPSAFHPTFLMQEFHRCQKTRADAFTNFHLEHFTHQLLKIVCPVIWNAEDKIVSPVHAKRFQHCALVNARHHHISLKSIFVESFLHTRRKHLTRVTSSRETS